MATDLLKQMGVAHEKITAWVTDQAERHGLLDKPVETMATEAA